MIERYTLPRMKSIWSEENKFNKWLEVEVAVCDAWNKLGKVPDTSLKKIKKNARFTIKRINEIEKTVDHDVIAFLTSVAEHVGPDSRFIHMGMTSSDVCDTALSLLLQEASQVIISDAENLTKVLRKKAKQYKDTVMIGRSHGIHAEPMTLGLKMALYAMEMERNLARLKAAKETVSTGKISGAVGTYSNITPKVEEIACKSLGLKRAEVSNQVVQRDRHAAFMCALAVTAGTIEKIATEVRNLQRTELMEAEEPFKKGQKGSSAMPHKRNPITCERLTGLARIMRANSIVALENIALWHERDISHSSTERIILPDSTILMDYMLQTITRVIDNLVVYPENMKKNLEKTGGLIFSQRLLLMLVGKGITREAAYNIVQRNAMKARGKKPLKEMISKDPEATKLLSSKEIDSAFSVDYYLRNIGEIYKRIGIST
ncbi:adenylosuccinate lyase [Candidatus Margulisiibacteriota bacterium]